MMTSLSPEQNFEVIEPLSVDVIDQQPVRFDTLGVLGSPNSLDGFQSVSAPASIDPTATMADLGTSIVIIPSPHHAHSSSRPTTHRAHSSSYKQITDLDECLLPDETALTASLSMASNRLISPDPIMRPSSDWEIMGQSIIADNSIQLLGSSNGKSPENNNESSLADKLKLFWNNARYQLKANTTGLSESQQICLLGKLYVPKQASSDDVFSYFKSSSSTRGRNNMGRTHFDRFKADFWSRIWITYRKDFSPLPNSEFASDMGWGCMIRSGQMMLAQAFTTHRMPRGWVYTSNSADHMKEHRQIIRWFGDSANKATSPFSIHQLTELSQECLSKRPGDWFGPSSIAVVLRKALLEAAIYCPGIEKVGMYVAVDCTVFLGDVRELMLKHEAVIIFVPVRLGMDSFDPSFEDTLKAFLSCKYSLGIIGGKPKHSLYFVGYQGSNLIYLDPHLCQPMVDTESDPNGFDVRTYHCDTPQKTSFSNIDPSLALGFLFNSSEFQDFHDKLSVILKKNRKVFSLSEASFADHQLQCNQLDDAGMDQMGFHNLVSTITPGASGSRTNRPTSSWFLPPLRRTTNANEHIRKSPRDDEGFIKIPKPTSSGKF